MLLVAAAVGALLAAVVALLRPAWLLRVPPAATVVAVAVGAVALATSDAAPTGWGPLDLLLRAAFGALVPAAASRAGTLPTAWLAVVASATVLVADAPVAPVVLGAAGAFLALTAAGTVTGPTAAIVAAAALSPLGHADWPLAAGASAAAVAVASVPVLAVGLFRTGSPARRRIAWALTAVVLVLALGAAAGLLAALSARSDVDRAVDLATDGIEQLGDDDVAARRDLLDAAGAFESAEDTLTTWWARSALLVPGVAQQSRAVSTMASAGGELARTAAEASAEADVDSVRPVDGRIDLDAVRALGPPLDRSVTSLRRADVRLAAVDGPVLLAPLADRLDDLRDEIHGALRSAELAAHAVDVAPGMLGGDGPRRYFLAFQNSAESTANGGFLGSWAEIVARDGQLVLSRSGRNRELSDGGPRPAARRIEGEEEFVSIYGQSAAHLWGNINFTPDHPTVSRIIAQLYPESGGAPLDGVIGITPHALAGFLALTGPVEVPGYPEPLTSENAARILLHDQYLEYPQEQAEEREGFLAAAVEGVFDRLTSGQLPGPRAIAAELGPAVDGRHLQLWSRERDEQALFSRIGAAGSVERTGGDSFGIVTQNLNGNKIDWFLHRELRYDVRWDPATGEVAGTMRATLRNDAPSTGLPSSVIGWGGDVSLGQRPVADGENHLWMTAYSSHPIERVTVDGEPVPVRLAEELGHQTARFTVSVAPESDVEVVIDVRGVVDPSDRYSLRMLRQPMVHPDEVAVRVLVPDGWRVSAATGSSAEATRKHALSRKDSATPVEMSVEARPEDSTVSWWDRVRGTPP